MSIKDKRNSNSVSISAHTDIQEGGGLHGHSAIDTGLINDYREGSSGTSEFLTSTGKKVAVGAGITVASVVGIVLILYESGLLSEWLAPYYRQPDRLNNEFIRKIVVGGSLAHWKNKKAKCPIIRPSRWQTDILKPSEYKSYIPLYDYIAINRVLSIDSRLVQIRDYDLYQNLIIQLKTGERMAILFADNTRYYAEGEDGVLHVVELPSAQYTTLSEVA